MSSPSSFSQPLNPRANVFLMINLGCEMLYVIDQRLKAQQISEEKSIQVIHDVTVVLLEPKFIDSLIVGSTHGNAQLLTVEHCKFMLNDIATSSLMRLDDTSMEKLWNLMTMIYKWQLFVSKHQHHLLDITFRHLNAVGRLYPDAKRMQLVDFTKNTLLDFWNSCADDEHLAIYRTNQAWLQCFNTKISLLIRMGFQMLDGSFIRDVDAVYYQDFINTIGENIYVKSVEIAAQHREELDAQNAAAGGGIGASAAAANRRVDHLAELLNIQQSESEDLKPIDASNFQKQYEKSLKQCNILFMDMDVNGTNAGTTATAKERETSSSKPSMSTNFFPDSSTQPGGYGGFVHLQPVYNRNSESSRSAAMSGTAGSGGGGCSGLNKDLLDLYSKMD